MSGTKNYDLLDGKGKRQGQVSIDGDRWSYQGDDGNKNQGRVEDTGNGLRRFVDDNGHTAAEDLAGGGSRVTYRQRANDPANFDSGTLKRKP